MKKYFIIVLLFTISCDNEVDILIYNSCDAERPIEQLDWLREKAQEMNEYDDDIKQYFYISQASYQDQTVFIFGNCCPFCNTVIPVMNCEGENIGTLGFDIEYEDISDENTILKPENFSCQI